MIPAERRLHALPASKDQLGGISARRNARLAADTPFPFTPQTHYTPLRASRPDKDMDMGKGQKSNKEVRKPKKEQPKKQNASNPSQKEGVVRGLDNMKN